MSSQICTILQVLSQSINNTVFYFKNSDKQNLFQLKIYVVFRYLEVYYHYRYKEYSSSIHNFPR